MNLIHRSGHGQFDYDHQYDLREDGLDTARDPVIAELTDQEIIDALDIIEKVRRNQEHTKLLTDKEVKMTRLMET